MLALSRSVGVTKSEKEERHPVAPALAGAKPPPPQQHPQKQLLQQQHQKQQPQQQPQKPQKPAKHVTLDVKEEVEEVEGRQHQTPTTGSLELLPTGHPLDAREGRSPAWSLATNSSGARPPHPSAPLPHTRTHRMLLQHPTG